jgi:apolipoprotein N-acyltransferase
MRFIRPAQWALVLCSSFLQVTVFPFAGPLPVWRAALAWVAITPFLVAILMPGRGGVVLRARDTAVLGYVCGILWYLGTCYWIYQTMYLYGGLAKPVSLFILILFSLYLGLYHALFAVLLSLARRTPSSLPAALLLSPAIWVATELARARVTGFPWDLLGYSQIDNLLVTKLAPLSGVMGVSFLLVAVNAGLAAMWLLRGRNRLLAPVVALCFSIVVIAGGRLPVVRHAGLEPGTQSAVLLQENLAVGAAERAQGESIRPMTTSEELATFIAQSESPADSDGLAAGPIVGSHAEVIVWPEAPSNLQSNDSYFRSQVATLARQQGAPVIAGSLGVDMDQAVAKGYWLYDSASLFSAAGTYQGRYDKIHLVPWGEYVPYKQFFSFADKLTAGAGNMDPGQARTVFHTGGHGYGVFICYESIFGDEVREFVHNGAQVLVNISDDGWYGDTGAPWQHLNMARMRAIENHRWLLRDTNTGITTAIDPWGRMNWQAPRHVRGAFVVHFNFIDGQAGGETIYTRFGDWFAWLCALVTLIACGLGFSRGLRKPRHARHTKDGVN